MSDSDFIKPSERYHSLSCSWEKDSHEICDCIYASHAVSDDLIRELAAALRNAVDALYDLEPLYESDWESERKALQRYERLYGGTE